MTSSYDPSYCLLEHLNYFHENVAGNISENDFDVVFSNPESSYKKTVDTVKPSAYVFIEKVFLVPNPLPMDTRPEPTSDKPSPSPDLSSSSMPLSPTSVRQTLTDPNETPSVAMPQATPVTSFDASSTAARYTPLAPSSLLISDDEETIMADATEAPTSPVVSATSMVLPSPVSSETVIAPKPSVSAAFELPPPPLTSSTAKDDNGELADTQPKKTYRKRRMSADGPDVRR